MTETNQEARQHTQALRDLSAQVIKGLSSAQIRRMVLPSQLIKLQEAILNGDAQAISFIMRDVAGEAISLAAGGSLHGGAAMEAISLAQAQCFVDIRAQYADLKIENISAMADIMASHRQSLIEWVDTGTAGSDQSRLVIQQESDLTRIGHHFLNTPALRQAAISTFVAAAAVIEAGFALFVSEK